MNFNRVKSCRHGTMIYNQNDVYIGRSLELYGEFSEGEVELFNQLVRPGDVVIEVGANIGAHTVFFARRAGNTGLVVAIEPQRLVFQTLCGNIAINSLTNVWTLHAACGAQPGTLRVPVLDPSRENNFGGLALEGETEGESVPVQTLDSLGLPRCKLLKIDVEGMERDVLRGAVGLIARTRPFLYVENDREDRASELIRLIDSLGYKMFEHTPPLFNPGNFAHNPNNIFGRIVSKNLFCAHQSVNLQAQGLKQILPA